MTCDLKYILLVQFIGFVAFFYLVTSVFRKKKEDVLAYQIIASFFFTVHYLFLDAMSGAISSIIVMLRNFGFYKFDKHPNIVAVIIILAFLLTSIITYDGIYSLFPIFGGIIYTLYMRGTKKDLLVGGIYNAASWGIYNLLAGSYVGVFTEVTVMFSNILALYKNKRKHK